MSALQQDYFLESRIHIRKAVYSVFYPVCRLLLRYGFNYRELVDILKKALVDAAREEGQIDGRKPTKARVAMLSGLTRQDTSRLLDSTLTEIPHKSNPQAQILGAWNSQPQWMTGKGTPRSLSMEQFTELCAEHTTSYTPNTILEEFLTSGKVEWTEKKKLRLLEVEYSPADSTRRFVTGMVAVNRVLNTVLNNLSTEPGTDRYYQQTVLSRFIPSSRRLELREKTKEAARDFHQEIGALYDLAEATLDGMEKDTVGLVAVYFEEPLDEKS
ncbi:MAG: DUF6502 family protein [Xanthomonadales bacterium]|nr:DUF6502 family protein [Xanthomonadales bacterium]